MHQLSPLRHAPHFIDSGGRPVLQCVSFGTQPSLRFLSTCLPWPRRWLAGGLSLDFRGTGLPTERTLGRAVVVEGGGWKRKPRYFGVQCADDERVWAPTEDELVEDITSAGVEKDAWESDLSNEDVRVLAKFQSVYNFVQVLEVSRRSEHPLAGCKLLLLDRSGNIQSVYHPYKLITSSYYDIFASLPPIIPDGTVGILGLGAGTAARMIHQFWPHINLHGWELDASVVMVARQFFDMKELEEGKPPVSGRSAFELEEDPSQLAEEGSIITGSPGTNSNDIGRLVVHIGDALSCKAPTEEGFAGLIVDLFSDGAVIPALQQPQTWQHLREQLKPGGRIMVNCGGSCVEADGKHAKDGNTTMEETIHALAKIFLNEVLRFEFPGKSNNSVALTGPSPDCQAWEQALPVILRDTVYGWLPIY